MSQRSPSVAFHITLLLGIHFLSRCYHLLLLPMAYDEAIYLRWATIIHAAPAQALISAFDGKPPLFFMLNALTLGIFDNLLLSSRIISVIAGALTVLGLYGIGAMLYTRRTGFIAALVYVSLPYSLIHDRIGLVDSVLTACAVATLALSLLLARYPEYYRSLSAALGAALGLGFLTKTPHLMFWVFPLLTIVLLGNWRDRRYGIGLGMAALVFLILAMPYLLYDSPQALTRSSKILHHQVDLWDSLIQTVMLQNPRMMAHLKEYGIAMWTYVTAPVLVLFFLGAVHQMIRRERRGLLLLAWASIPPIPFLIIGEVAFARYFLIAIPPVALLAALGLEWGWQKLEKVWKRLQEPMWNRALRWGSILLVLLPAWLWNADLLTRPTQARWTPLDHWQYVRYTSGPTAVQNAVHYFKQEAQVQPIFVFLTFKPGIPSDALYLYLKDTPNVTITDSWFGLDLPSALEKASSIRLAKSKYEYPETSGTLTRDTLTGRPIYFVANTTWYKPEEVLHANPNLHIVKTYQDLDPTGFFSFIIYKMDPPLPAAS